MEFTDTTFEEFRNAFIGAVSKGSYNNTYKFALARFLLEYCNQTKPNMKVRYSTIAKYFFKYYWLQECKSRLRQGPQNQQPIIISIIRDEFHKKTYPQTYEEIRKKEPEKTARCIEKITKKCFDDVIPRFQGRGGDLFFKYFAKEYNDSARNKKIDPNGGILINEDAAKFLKTENTSLYKTVILEWIRFLEARNFGTPNLVRKIEGQSMNSRDQNKFRKLLRPFFDSCFYCESKVVFDRNTHLDHVIPYDYIGNTELWNIVVSCQKCNCIKSGRQPSDKYIKKLFKRNTEHMESIRGMKKSILMLEHGDKTINWHYCNAKQHGYPVWRRDKIEPTRV